MPWTVFSCINIKSFSVTKSEAKLLNEINSFHCDYHYGYEPFTAKDVVVSLSDVITLYKFLETSKEIFNYGLGKASIDWLGFVNISNSAIIPYIAKNSSSKSSSNFSSLSSSPSLSLSNYSSNESPCYQKYIPQSLIEQNVLLVKVNKIEMDEWDASYLRMLCIYAGLEHYQIQSNDSLCLLNDIKWDSSLSPLLIQEYHLPVSKVPFKLNYSKPVNTSISSSHTSSIYSTSSKSLPLSSSPLNDLNWLLSSSSNVSSSSPLSSLHTVTKIEINGSSFRAINLKPYLTQQAVFVSDVVAKLFQGASLLTVHYLLEKILQVKLYEYNR